MARPAFNWSVLDRDMLYSMLYQLKPEIVDKRLPIGEITKLMSKHIKAHFLKSCSEGFLCTDYSKS